MGQQPSFPSTSSQLSGINPLDLTLSQLLTYCSAPFQPSQISNPNPQTQYSNIDDQNRAQPSSSVSNISSQNNNQATGPSLVLSGSHGSQTSLNSCDISQGSKQQESDTQALNNEENMIPVTIIQGINADSYENLQDQVK